MKKKGGIRRGFIDAATMFVVSGLSLILLMYVGYGEAQRTFLQLHLDKLTSQGRVVQNAMETFLRPGLPLRQFVGFGTLAEPILASDDAIAAMSVFDQDGTMIFAGGGKSIDMLPTTATMGQPDDKGYAVRQAGSYYQVILPLRSRFEDVGQLVISMPRDVVTMRVQASFQPLLFVALGLSVLFALCVVLGGPRLKDRRTRALQIVYAITFMAMAAFVVGTLISLYSDGVQAKTKALADSLGQRLAEVVRFNLNIEEIHGLDRTFSDYSRLNPNISAAGLIIDGVVHVHTDASQTGRPWITSSRSYEYVVPLTGPDSVRDIRVAVAVPTDVVFRQIARSVKNFAALFVASAFLAGLFLQLAGSLRRSEDDDVARRADQKVDDDTALDLVKPVFFVAVFLEHLNYAFLPQFVYEVAARAGLSEGFGAAPFMAYYLFFALALVPAGHFAQHRSARPLMYLGLMLAGAGLLLLASGADFWLVVLARSLSGIGQGMLFIGVQSYILTMASPSRRTRGAAIIVFGFQGGMISGMAVGSLLVTYMGPTGVFTLSGMIAYALALYALSAVPLAAPVQDIGMRMGVTWSQLVRNMGQVMRSLDFLKTMFLIGIPAKAVLTGVVIFALPLLLAQREYAQEDIGQIIMIYAAGVVLASGYVSRLVDRTGQTYSILFMGAAISAVGLFLIGLIDWAPLSAGDGGSTVMTAVLILGVATLGVAHGFINAPVVTHVADSELASRIGTSSLTATYRFLERVGHIAGPIIIGQLFLFWGQSAALLSWLGLAVLLCGVLFLMPSTPGQGSAATREV